MHILWNATAQGCSRCPAYTFNNRAGNVKCYDYFSAPNTAIQPTISPSTRTARNLRTTLVFKSGACAPRSIDLAWTRPRPCCCEKNKTSCAAKP